MQVMAVGGPIGRAVASFNPTPKRQAGDLPRVAGRYDAESIGCCDFGLEEARHAEAAENARAVGADLNTGPFFGWICAALEYPRWQAALCEGQSRGEAADTTA